MRLVVHFHTDGAAYIWIGKAAQPYHYHEVCMILHCNTEKADYNALDQVRAWLSATDNPKLLETLFDLDDDLSRDATWEIDSTSPEEAPVEPTLRQKIGHERSVKLFRQVREFSIWSLFGGMAQTLPNSWSFCLARFLGSCPVFNSNNVYMSQLVHTSLKKIIMAHIISHVSCISNCGYHIIMTEWI